MLINFNIEKLDKLKLAQAQEWDNANLLAVKSARNVLTNRSFNTDKQFSGPPKNITFPLIGFPHANPLIV